MCTGIFLCNPNKCVWGVVLSFPFFPVVPGKVTEYFSYEHFYVVFCRFYELDADRDGRLSGEDLMKYGEHGLSSLIVDRYRWSYHTRFLASRFSWGRVMIDTCARCIDCCVRIKASLHLVVRCCSPPMVSCHDVDIRNTERTIGCTRASVHSDAPLLACNIMACDASLM